MWRSQNILAGSDIHLADERNINALQASELRWNSLLVDAGISIATRRTSRAEFNTNGIFIRVNRHGFIAGDRKAVLT